MQNEELRDTQQELDQSQRKYVELFESAPVGYLILDTEARVIEINRMGIKILGRPVDKLKGHPLSMCIDRADLAAFMAHKKTVLADGLRHECELNITNPDGTRASVYLVSEPVKNAAGKIIQCRTTITDSTERAQETLRVSEAKYRRLYDSMRDAFAVVEMNGNIKECNQAYLDMLGYTWEEISKLTYIDITPEKWHAFEADIVEKQVLPKGYSDIYEKEYRRENGEVFPIEIRTFLITDDAGKPSVMWGIVRDITDRKRTAEALRKSEERLRLASEASSIGTWDWDLVSNECEWDQKASSLVGLKFGGPTSFEIFANTIHPEDRECVRQKVQCAIEEKQDYIVEFRVALQGGMIRWLFAKGKAFYDEHGKPLRMSGACLDITERKRGENALRVSLERLELAQRAARTGFWDWDISTGKLTWSKELYELFGLASTEEACFETWLSLVHADDRQSAMARIDRDMKERTPHESEYRIIRSDGQERWIIALGNTCYDEAGRPERMCGICQDITERKRTEDALRESEQRYRNLFESMGEGFALCEMIYDEANKPVNFRYLKVNPAFARLTGLPVDRVEGRTVREVIPGIEPFWVEAYGRVVESGLAERIDHAVTELGKQYEVFAWRTDKGRFAALFTDVTARRQAEEALRMSEEKFRSIVESSTIAMHFYRIESDGRLILVGTNPATDRITGIAHRPLLGKTIEEAFPKLSDTAIPDLYRKVARGELGPQSFEIAYVDNRFSGTYNVRVFKTGPITIAVNFEDITYRKRSEEELRKSEERLKLTFDAVNDGIWDWHIPTGKAKFSPHYYTMLGYEPYEFPQDYESWKSLVHSDDIEMAEQKIRKCLESDEGYAIEIRMRTKAGGWRWIQSRGNVVERDESNHPIRMLGTHSDITERKEAERQAIQYQKELAHASRLSTIGEMASSIAHELNQPLCAILTHSEGCLRMLKSRAHESDKLVGKMETVAKQAERAGVIINRIKGFVRKDTAGLKDININDIVREVATFVKAETKRLGIKVHLDLDQSVPLILGDAVQIEEVILNFVKNSIDAMEDGAKKAKSLSITTLLRPDNMIDTAVCDSGKGISAEHLPKIFESFFTTKSHGLGIGLSISKSIIEAHGGKIYVITNSDGGATFGFRLPVLRQPSLGAKNRNTVFLRSERDGA